MVYEGSTVITHPYHNLNGALTERYEWIYDMNE